MERGDKRKGKVRGREGEGGGGGGDPLRWAVPLLWPNA